MLVAMAVAGMIGAAVVTIAITSQKLVEQDQHRTALNQNLRVAVDLLGTDLRQLGDRMPRDMAALEIVNGAAGAPDTLVVRRGIMDDVMPLCEPIVSGNTDTSVFVAKPLVTGSEPAGCTPIADSNSDGWPDNMEAWRAQRIAGGGSVLAFVYNPVTELGEYFTYDGENSATFYLHKGNADAWINDYPTNQEPRIYILEERRFALAGGILQCVVNGDSSNPLNLVDRVDDFQVRATLKDSSVVTGFSASEDWTRIRHVELTLTGSSDFGSRQLERVVSTRFFPRNILTN